MTNPNLNPTTDQRCDNAGFSLGYESSILTFFKSPMKLGAFAVGFALYYAFKESIKLVPDETSEEFLNTLVYTFIDTNRAIATQYNISIPNELLYPNSTTTTLIKNQFAEVDWLNTLLPDFEFTDALKATGIDIGFSGIVSCCTLIIDLIKNSNHVYSLLKKSNSGQIPAASFLLQPKSHEWQSFRRRLFDLSSMPIGGAIAGIWLQYTLYQIFVLTFIQSVGLSLLAVIGIPLTIGGREIYSMRKDNELRASSQTPSIAPTMTFLPTEPHASVTTLHTTRWPFNPVTAGAAVQPPILGATAGGGYVVDDSQQTVMGFGRL